MAEKRLRVTEQIVRFLVENELEEIALRLWRVGRGRSAGGTNCPRRQFTRLLVRSRESIPFFVEIRRLDLSGSSLTLGDSHFSLNGRAQRLEMPHPAYAA